MSVTKVTLAEITTDQAPVYRVVLEELLSAAWHRTDQYANNRVEADHGRLEARLRPMRGLKQGRANAGQLLAVKDGIQQLLEQFELTDDERAVLEGDRDALAALVERLADPRPRQGPHPGSWARPTRSSR
jgi:DDE domain